MSFRTSPDKKHINMVLHFIFTINEMDEFRTSTSASSIFMDTYPLIAERMCGIQHRVLYQVHSKHNMRLLKAELSLHL